jgi:hypothetical protein
MKGIMKLTAAHSSPVERDGLMGEKHCRLGSSCQCSHEPACEPNKRQKVRDGIQRPGQSEVNRTWDKCEWGPRKGGAKMTRKPKESSFEDVSLGEDI